MSESLFSPSWYRVAELRPRLRSHVNIHRHHYRGQLWYVLQDKVGATYHRFSPAAWHIIGLMNGERKVQSIWEAGNNRLGDDAPTQEEIIDILGRLHQADVLQCDVTPDSEELFRRHRRQQGARWKQRLWSPLSLRFPLLDPDRALDRWLPLVAPAFTLVGLLVWLVAVGLAAVATTSHWDALLAYGSDHALSAYNLLLLWLAFPLVKALHELGHAFATKRWGGEVHEMGIMLLVLMPVPYVDSSSAWVFREKHRRLLVGAAGMMVELLLAAIALWLWLRVEDGLVRQLAFNIMLIGGISTLMFNANPLLRFDGYYMLSDALDIPNLSSRANQHLKHLAQRYLLGMDTSQSPASARGEAGWFTGYGIAAFFYRLAILFIIAVFIASEYPLLGVLLAGWAILTQILVPVLKGIGFVLRNPHVQRRPLRATGTSALLLAGILLGVFFLPLPLWTQAQGVVWLPEQAQVRTGTEGSVTRLLVTPGSRVQRGEALLETSDPFLQARIKVREAELREAQARLTAEQHTDRSRAEVLKQELATAQASLARVRERSAQQVVRSPADGIAVIPGSEDLPGRFLKQGEVVAYITDPDQLTVRVVVEQADAGLVRQRTRGVAVRLAQHPGERYDASVKRQVPAASNRLPNRALGSLGGGRFTVDPADEEGLTTYEKVFQLDLALDSDDASNLGAYMGGRVHVRFDHGHETLAGQVYRSLRQLFLREFNV